MDIYGSSSDRKDPRRPTSKLIAWIGTSFVLLMLYLTVTATLNVREISKLSKQLHALEMNITKLENDNHSHGILTDSLVNRDIVPSSTAPSLVLVPHPVYYNVHTMPMMYPNTTAVSVRGEGDNELEKRYLWWVLGGACKFQFLPYLFLARPWDLPTRITRSTC